MAACNRRRKVGPRGGDRGCARTLVGLPHYCLRVVGSWVGLDHCHIGAQPKFCVGVGLCLVLWYRICIMLSLLCILIIFHLYSNICLAKHVFCNTSRTMSIVKAYVSKDCLFLVFWIIIGGRMLSLVTTNKSPKLNLCSSRANS